MGHYCVTPLRFTPVLDLALGNVLLDSGHAVAAYSFCRLAALLLFARQDRSADAVKTYACSDPAPLAGFEVGLPHF